MAVCSVGTIRAAQRFARGECGSKGTFDARKQGHLPTRHVLSLYGSQEYPHGKWVTRTWDQYTLLLSLSPLFASSTPSSLPCHFPY